MKILFMIPFCNNIYYLEPILKQFKKNITNDLYDIVILNDAPKKDEKTQMNFISVLSRNLDCNKEIEDECRRLNIKHINIPEDIHPWRNFPSHASNRHAELVNWFLKNFEKLYNDHESVDFICLYDADLFLVKPTDFGKILKNYDIIAPMVYDRKLYYPQPSLMFINLKTVTNYKKMDFSLKYKDMGSGVHDFLRRNKNYRILEAGIFNGFWNENFEKESKFIKKINFEGGEKCLKYYDVWLDDRFVHLRWGVGAGRGITDVNRELEPYITRIKLILDIYGIELDFEKWINNK